MEARNGDGQAMHPSMMLIADDECDDDDGDVDDDEDGGEADMVRNMTMKMMMPMTMMMVTLVVVIERPLRALAMGKDVAVKAGAI